MLNYLEKAKIFEITNVSEINKIQIIDPKKDQLISKARKVARLFLYVLYKKNLLQQFLIIQYILENIMMATTLTNLCTTRYDFID